MKDYSNNKEKFIKKYKIKNNKIVCYLTNKDKILLDNTEENQLKVLNIMEKQFRNASENYQCYKKYKKVKDQVIDLYIILFMLIFTALLSVITAFTSHAVLPLLLLKILGGSCAITYIGVKIKKNTKNNLKKDIEKCQKYLSNKDEFDRINSKTLEKNNVLSINPKTIEIIKNNNLVLVPPININSIEEIPLKDLNILLDSMESKDKVLIKTLKKPV